MNIADIIALAKMGYKKQDIKELIEMADSKELPPTDAVSQSVSNDTASVLPEETPEGKAPEQTVPTVKEPENVAKEPIQHDSDNEVKQLKEQIKQLQEANTRKDVSGNVENDADVIEDLVRSYM